MAGIIPAGAPVKAPKRQFVFVFYQLRQKQLFGDECVLREVRGFARRPSELEMQLPPESIRLLGLQGGGRRFQCWRWKDLQGRRAGSQKKGEQGK